MKEEIGRLWWLNVLVDGVVGEMSTEQRVQLMLLQCCLL